MSRTFRWATESCAPFATQSCCRRSLEWYVEWHLQRSKSVNVCSPITSTQPMTALYLPTLVVFLMLIVTDSHCMGDHR